MILVWGYMKTFEKVQFNGTLRDYQQKVYDNALKYLSDRKIHIVAAPGSGKTILGLALICSLNAPALILSPTVTIRQQWGMRFQEKFLPSSEKLHDYISNDLKMPKLLTSITYQSLHAAYNRIADQQGRTGINEIPGINDYSGFDLIGEVKKAGIKTICLDEAHHLRSEWHKALQGFINKIGKDIKIIALTATPPYDSTPNEWKRYVSLCGEIDEEIFVPQLVAQKTLCPHQDYIYFNYPTEGEIKILKQHKERTTACVDSILHNGLFQNAVDNSHLLTHYREKTEMILDNVKGFIAILCLAKHVGISIPKKLIKLVSPSGKLPVFKMSFAETAFEFILAQPQIFTAETALQLRAQLSKNALIDKNKVCLVSNSRIDRMLVSSTGKLGSIVDIVREEAQKLGDKLRMVILTDYIRKGMLANIGTNNMFGVMGAVPIFETVRRAMKNGVRLAILTGSLVVVPNNAVDDIKQISQSTGIHCSFKPLPETCYGMVSFGGSNKNKVEVITEVFERGRINIIIGTKSLLGEGWDSPCINSLILASFVGSYMLSNQMRGRAIRIDKHQPDKTANIWHLVTLEPPLKLTDKVKGAVLGKYYEDNYKPVSSDYNMLVRRFECFFAPAYQKERIETGIERVDIIRPPFDQEGIQNINRQMLTQAADRANMANKWGTTLYGRTNPKFFHINEAPPSILPKGFLFTNALYVTFLSIILTVLIRSITIVPYSANSLLMFLASGVGCFVLIYAMINGFYKVLHHISPERTIKTLSECILKTLKEIGYIKSESARVSIRSQGLGLSVYCTLISATVREKNIFAKAVQELLTSIDNPRYILIKKSVFWLGGKKRYVHSYACPSIIGAHREKVSILAKHLKKTTGAFCLMYTRSEAGRKDLLRCRRYSYINRNEIFIKGKKIAAPKWE